MSIRTLFAWLLCASGYVFALETSNAEIAYLRLTGDYWQVWLTDARGDAHRQATFDAVDKTRVSWNPDHSRLLCSSNDGNLATIDVTSLRSERVALDSAAVYDAQWSADGERIAYTATTSLQADNAEVWIAQIDGSGKRKVSGHIAVALTPAWNPSTGNILYSAGQPGKNQELWQIDPRSGDNTQLTASHSSALDPSVNAAGAIVYSSDAMGSYDIWLLDGARPPRRLTQNDAYDAQPSWSPDGKKIVFYRLQDGTRRLWVHEMADGREYPITPSTVASRYPAWNR